MAVTNSSKRQSPSFQHNHQFPPGYRGGGIIASSNKNSRANTIIGMNQLMTGSAGTQQRLATAGNISKNKMHMMQTQMGDEHIYMTSPSNP